MVNAASSYWPKRLAIAVVFALAVVGVPSGHVRADPVVFGSINTGALPIDIAITPDGTHGYVTNNGNGSVSVIDTTTNTTVGEPIPVGNGPHDVAVTPDGTRAYVTNYDSGSVSVIDTTANTTVGNPISIGGSPWDIALTPDGTRAYVTNVSRFVSIIDTRTNLATSAITTSGVTHGVAFTPDGTRAYVTNFGQGSVSVIDTTSNTTVGDPIGVGSLPEGIALTPDGSHAFVANTGSNSVSVIDTGSNATVGEPIDLGPWPYGVAVSPDGSKVYVTNSEGSAVSVIDATNRTVGAPITVGAKPYGVAITPEGSRAYVVNSGHYYVSVIALQPSPPLAVNAIAGNGQITAAWQPPSFTGGQPITAYTATADPGGRQCGTDGATTCAITGLTNGASYSVTVTAGNSIGVSMRSQPSLAVTPQAPVDPMPPDTAPTPGRVTGLKATVRKGRVTIRWRPVADVSVYQVRISKPGVKKYRAWKMTAQRIFKAKVRRGKTYRFQVRSLGAGGKGPVATIRFAGK